MLEVGPTTPLTRFRIVPSRQKDGGTVASEYDCQWEASSYRNVSDVSTGASPDEEGAGVRYIRT